MRNTESIIGDSVALAQALEHVSRLAPINRPVLVLGARGTGKELIAERLHFLSARWDAPLLKVNCAAMADALLESELFGHEVGAFTGATRAHQGRFERADGGTLFLDELGTMSPRLQEKLLRLVEYGEFERLGGQDTRQVDVRVIAATHTDLRQQVAEGAFRADLLDRLSFDVIHLPPLCERPGDIPLLAEHFAMQMCAELGWELFPGFTDAAMSALCRHRWPGNIRELKNAVERSLHRWGDPTQAVHEVVIDPFTPPWAVAEDQPEPPLQAVAADAPPPVADFPERVQAYERKLVQEGLRQNGHNQRRTAEALGLSYDQLRGLVRKHGLGGRRNNHGQESST